MQARGVNKTAHDPEKMDSGFRIKIMRKSAMSEIG
jgi:hypothetical protein